MANFAKLDDSNIVIEVLALSNDVIDNLPFPESEPIGVAFFTELSGGHTNWKQTSYNSNFRKRLASIGYTYDPVLDGFFSPKPFPSWLLDTRTCDWVPPTPYPSDGNMYNWDESTRTWILID